MELPVARRLAANWAGDVKKNCGTDRLIYHARGSLPSQSDGKAVYFLARGGMPLIRAQGLVGQPDFRESKLAWHVENAAMHQGEVAHAAPPQVSVRSLLRTSLLSIAPWPARSKPGHQRIFWL